METITYLQEKPVILRKEVLAFIITYGLIAPLSYSLINVEFIYLKFFFVLVLFFNCLYYLITETNAEYKARNRFNEVTDIKQAMFVKFVKLSKTQKKEVNVIKLENVRLTLKDSAKKDIIFFYRHKIRYYFDADEKRFRKVKPFIKQEIRGMVDKQKVNLFSTEVEELLMDDNVLSFPLPNFKLLYKQQLMDPLNFFQLFSVALWFFDENIFHPLMILCLLLITNFTVCMQRIGTIMNLRTLQTSPYVVSVYNKKTKSFEKRSSEELQPGDIIVVQRSETLKKAESKHLNNNDIEDLRKQIPFGSKIPIQVFEKLMKQNSGDKEQSIVNSSDLLILSGTVAVDESILTGENLPQTKDCISDKHYKDIFDKKRFKNNIVYAGTDVVQTTPDQRTGDVTALVLNTGFTTTKGKLARTVLFNEETNNVSQIDAYILLFLLLIVSLISSLYVLLKGLDDPDRNKDKLFIRCILIVTSVVPPELPMIMAMSVNNSILYLKKKRIFCTEPFRIPFAGKVEVCVFDKTGTLTQEQLLLKAIAIYDGKKEELDYVDNLKTEHLNSNDQVNVVLGGCHSLLEIKGVLTGDPIEMLYFNTFDYGYNSSTKTAFYKKNQNKSLKIHRINHFNSELKRMSAVVSTNNYGIENGHYLVSKGAPEMIEKLLRNVPKNYRKWYNSYANKGFRLLALAIKKITPEEARCEDRFEMEKDLDFVGFFVLGNNLKKDTKKYITHIHRAGKEIVVLTGDHLLTSIQTYRTLGITEKRFLRVRFEDDVTVFVDKDENRVESYGPDYNLAIDGANLEKLMFIRPELIRELKVIARVSPKQKELYIERVKETAKVLMCGDGTNDVGALKKADVGIALVGTKDEPTKEVKAERKRKKDEILKRAIKERKMVKPSEINFDHEDLDFKLGDASIAAPFTNKHSNSIKCVETILKQGVCTLSCGIQSYRIVTLTSFLTAYSLSSLHLENLRFSDMQNTMIGIYGAYLYFTLSNGKPVKTLPKDKPQTSIFNRYFWLSLFGQLALQFSCLFILMNFAKKHAPEEQKEIDNEDEFEPTFINSVMFLYDLSSMFCISIFNYEGRPFMISLSENKKHFKFIILPVFILFVLIFNLSDFITELFQTTYKSTHEDSETFLAVVIFSFIGLTYLWTLFVKYLKVGRIDKWI